MIEKTTVLGGGDDAIVLKSDWSLGAQLDSSNITVRDCTVGSWGNNALQIGSETVGDFTGIRWQRIRVRLRRHRFWAIPSRIFQLQFSRAFPAPPRPMLSVCRALLRAHGRRVLTGAWNPMLWPIWGCRSSTPGKLALAW